MLRRLSDKVTAIGDRIPLIDPCPSEMESVAGNGVSSRAIGLERDDRGHEFEIRF